MSVVHDRPLSAVKDEWAVLGSAERVRAFATLPPADAEAFFRRLSPPDQAELLLALPPGERRLWMRALPPDDAADVSQEAPAEERDGLLALLDEPTRKEVTALLAYAEDDAGGLMNPRYARLRPDMSVDEAISYLRRQARERVGTLYYVYVLDAEQHLLGVVSFRELFAAPADQRVRDVMHTRRGHGHARTWTRRRSAGSSPSTTSSPSRSSTGQDA